LGKESRPDVEFHDAPPLSGDLCGSCCSIAAKRVGMGNAVISGSSIILAFLKR
jgi:hypothetical protein